MVTTLYRIEGIGPEDTGPGDDVWLLFEQLGTGKVRVVDRVNFDDYEFELAPLLRALRQALLLEPGEATRLDLADAKVAHVWRYELDGSPDLWSEGGWVYEHSCEARYGIGPKAMNELIGLLTGWLNVEESERDEVRPDGPDRGERGGLIGQGEY